MNPQEQPAPPTTQEQRDVVMKGHHYDGIREYDNPMPGWWIWLFWATFLFAVIYVPGVHVFGIFDTYEEDLAQSQADLQAVRDAYAASNPTATMDEATLATYADDPAAVEAGQAIFALNCMPCHGPDGGGTIGPNLTDNYWIHGNQLTDMYQVVTNGVLEKGMTPWESILTVEERAQVVAFVHSLIGTAPANPKAPQGELYES